MRFDDQTQGMLEERVQIGNKAKSVWHSYMKGYTEKRFTEYHREFLNTNDMDRIMELKRLQLSLSELIQQILSDIESGHIAQQQLERG